MMLKYQYRYHKIERTCEKQYQDYRNYLSFLKKDFSDHCCYCNISGRVLETTSFQIDHYIPKACFRGVKDELLTQYNNLMLCCPKCNRAKSNQFEGDILSDTIENQLFYNPDTVDYNTIFYRNEIGGISSDDEKGKDMIRRLKLYLPLHQHAWLLEKMDNVIDLLDKKIEGAEETKKKELQEEHYKLLRSYRKQRAHFVAAYNRKERT